MSRGVFRGLIETTSGKLDYGFNLLAVQPIEPFHNVVDTRSGFKVLEYGGYRHSSSLENPCAADLAGNTLHGRALGPIERCHVPTFLSS
jgi:hypothetical protein